MSGLLIIILDAIFMVWASVGKIWYIYLLNFALLFIASSMINTSWIQGIARGYSYIHLFGAKGLPKAMGVNIPTLVLFIIAYFISKIVFITQIQIASFFRSEEHTSELQSHSFISYAVFCLKKKKYK